MLPHPVSPKNNIIISVPKHNILNQYPLPCLGEIADTFHISDDAGQIIHILAVTFGTFMQISFVDMMAFVTYCIRNIECEVVATFGSGNTKQLPVLLFAKMLFQIHVQSRTTRQMLDITMPVQAEFIDNVQRFVFYNIEIAVVTFAVSLESGFLCPISRVSHPHFRQESFRS